VSILAFDAGDDVVLDVTATADMTGSAVYWTLKRSVLDADAEALLELSTTGGGITVAGSTATISLTAVQTAALPTEGHLVWGLAVRDGALRVHTLADGIAWVRPAVRRSIP
jgi:hypothetical protein